MSYTDSLNQLWASHLAPRSPDAPTVISTFAGCGGSSLGYSAAGFRELLAVEWDAHAAECLRTNFHGLDVYHGDINALSVDEVLGRSGLKPGELDVFDGSPPCQGFSTSGRRDVNDPRNQLFRQFVRLLSGLQPRAFVMENVSGMVKGHMKLIFRDVLKELEGAGYRVSARLLNAQYFGVPQSRPRMIFVGTRNDLCVAPTHPMPVTHPISAGTALRGVVNDSTEITDLLAAGQKYAAYLNWGIVPIGSDLHSVTGGAGFSCKKIDPAKPSNCVCKNDSSVSMHGLMHWLEQRRFTSAEYKRLASFPDQYRFPGKWADAVARIGNSVPPVFMFHIARHVRASVLDKSWARRAA